MWLTFTLLPACFLTMVTSNDKVFQKLIPITSSLDKDNNSFSGLLRAINYESFKDYRRGGTTVLTTTKRKPLRGEKRSFNHLNNNLKYLNTTGAISVSGINQRKFMYGNSKHNASEALHPDIETSSTISAFNEILLDGSTIKPKQTINLKIPEYARREPAISTEVVPTRSAKTESSKSTRNTPQSLRQKRGFRASVADRIAHGFGKRAHISRQPGGMENVRITNWSSCDYADRKLKHA